MVNAFKLKCIYTSVSKPSVLNASWLDTPKFHS